MPDTLIKELAEEWYDTLADHAKRIRDIVFGSDQRKIPVHISRSSLWDLIPSRQVIKVVQTKDSGRTPEDAEYEKLTWGFIGLALGSVVAYFAIMGSPIRVVRVVQEDEEDEEDGDIVQLDDFEE